MFNEVKFIIISLISLTNNHGYGLSEKTNSCLSNYLCLENI